MYVVKFSGRWQENFAIFYCHACNETVRRTVWNSKEEDRNIQRLRMYEADKEKMGRNKIYCISDKIFMDIIGSTCGGQFVLI